MIKHIADETKRLISSGKTSEAVQYLFNNLERANIEINDELVLLSGRLKKLEKNSRENLISWSDINVEYSNINKSIIDLLNEISAITETIKDDKNTDNKEFIFLEKILENIDKLQSTIKKITISTKLFDESISNHEKEVEAWASTINFKDSNGSKLLSNVYIDLDYYVTPARLIDTESKRAIINIDKLLEVTPGNIVIFGQAGAGKTTTIKKIIQKSLKEINKYSKFSFVVLIRLRELNSLKNNAYKFFLFERIFSILGIEIDFDTTRTDYGQNLLNRVITNLLDELKILLILDGFDELKNEMKPIFFPRLNSYLMV
ncbi:NACHT domain-containing protein [Haliscomenobacter sp.]|uniref:NACHT domain-containing protein n=1 Tax=Haliscomenobacter sp. TaxID=2717303 RepID=UPI003BAB0CC6